MKLLIIDDEAHIRLMMRLTLEAAGYEVDEAATGEEGLARFGDGTRLRRGPARSEDAGIDGLQTLRRLKALKPEVCVIMVTAFASIELAVDALKLGATDFLRKPMTPETLRGAVSAALASRPRTPIKAAGSVAEHPTPQIETLTFNGFRVIRPRTAPIVTTRSARVPRQAVSRRRRGAGDRRDRSRGRRPRGASQPPSAPARRLVLAGAGRASVDGVPVERREDAGERPADGPRRVARRHRRRAAAWELD